MAALLAGEALQMIDVGPGSHHHLEGGDHFITGGAVASGAKQAEVVSLAEQEVPLGVERVAHLPQPGVTAAALEAVLVPEHVQRLNTDTIITMSAFATMQQMLEKYEIFDVITQIDRFNFLTGKTCRY